MPDKMNETRIGEHQTHALQVAALLHEARAFFYQHPRLNDAREGLDKIANVKMCAAPEPTSGASDGLFSLPSKT